MAVRIQRKRTKGWRSPKGAVYVGRGSFWGNPWSIRQGYTIEQVVDAYRQWMEVATAIRPDGTRTTKKEICVVQLRGKDLMCWCPLDQPCHADVLLEIANSELQGKKTG